MEFLINNTNPGTKVWVTEQDPGNSILYAQVRLESEEAQPLAPFSVSFSLPSVDAHSIWSPKTGTLGMRNLGPEWKKKTTDACLASGMPLHAVLSASGRNRLTVAVSDIKTPTSIGTGIREENAQIICKVTFFTQCTSAVTDYAATVRIDLRDIPFYDSIPQAVSWWEEEWGWKPDPAPEAAMLPMNSLWYSFHQNLRTPDILRECRLSKPLGMDTVILDDGWQTDDNNRGYAYCGDWELATAKIPDMRHLADQIHQLGMKLILWYSVPYVGVHSKVFEQFRGKYLYFDARRGTASLDPRYACVREYLVGQYETAVKSWDLDGLKLDFISAFRLTEESLAPDPERDHDSLEDAVECLLQEISQRLRRIKPDILIEFRQPYTGPAMRQHGNMLRAGDCPNDWLCNKTAILDLRLTSGKTPVHSDMLMWHPEEPAECAALQIAAVLFSVPQISVLLEKISPQQKQMLQYYLDFWIRNRKLLLEGKLILSDPQAYYSKATACLGDEAITVLYTDTTVTKQAARTTVVNCGAARRIYLDGFEGASYRIVDCMGSELAQGSLDALSVLTLPCAGMVFLDS